jgi:group I intron endonuclease
MKMSKKKKEIIAGIYCIINLLDGKMYIGWAIDIIKRWKQHINLLNKNKHWNNYLQHAWNKYKEENFCFKIIEIYDPDLDHLKLMEIYFIALNNSYVLDGGGYNMTRGGDGSLGLSHTEETKKKQSDVKKGKPSKLKGVKQSKEVVERRASFLRGKPSPQKGVKRSEESKKKMSDAQKGHAPTKGFTGRKHTEESKQKMAKGSTGKKHSEESKNKISQSNMGRPGIVLNQDKKDHLSSVDQGVKKRKNSSSKYIGVSYFERTGKYVAKINYRRKSYYLGYFVLEIEAAHAYDMKALELYGPNAKVNFKNWPSID